MVIQYLNTFEMKYVANKKGKIPCDFKSRRNSQIGDAESGVDI